MAKLQKYDFNGIELKPDNMGEWVRESDVVDMLEVMKGESFGLCTWSKPTIDEAISRIKETTK